MSMNVKSEIDSLEPVSMFTITAKLFNHVTVSVIDFFGEDGKAMVEAGVRQLTDEQSRELGERTGKETYQLNNHALFSYDHLLTSDIVEETFHQYKSVQEQEGLEPLTIYAMMAKMFAHVTKAVVDRFGEKGQEAIMKGVETFGSERGADIARRAAVNGKPNTIENYLSNYDMGRSELFEYETLFHPMEIEQTFTKCAFGEQWKKDGMGEYGILYCHMIDPSIAKGYNPKFEVIHDKYVLREGACHFRFQLKETEEK